jgi:hypothetical protein
MSEAQESRPDDSQASQVSQDHDKDDESNAQKVYLESNNSRKQLFLMCVGLMDGGSSIFDLEAEPWNTIKKRDIKPTRSEYAGEVRWRGNLLSTGILKTANWSATKCFEWLEAHPLTDETDILFLKNEVHRVKAIIFRDSWQIQTSKKYANT